MDSDRPARLIRIAWCWDMGGGLPTFATVWRGRPELLLAAWRTMRGKVEHRADFAAIESAREVIA